MPLLMLLAACTSTESVLTVSENGGPTPPAPIGIETAASQNPVGFAPDPQTTAAPAQSVVAAQSIEPAPAAPSPIVQPAPVAVAPPPVAAQAAPAAPPVAAAPRTAAIAPQSGTIVQVAPIVGATQSSVVPLSQRLALRAAERGVRLSNTPGGSLVMRGYFSAMRQGSDAVVIFVWDVIDSAGNRVHRIQGQETVRMGGNGDPWTAVDNRTMEKIADRTVDDLSAWLGARSG